MGFLSSVSLLLLFSFFFYCILLPKAMDEDEAEVLVRVMNAWGALSNRRFVAEVGCIPIPMLSSPVYVHVCIVLLLLLLQSAHYQKQKQ